MVLVAGWGLRVALRDGFVGWRFLGVTEVGGRWWVCAGCRLRDAGCGMRVAGCAQGWFCWLALSGDDVTVGMVFVVAAVGVYLPAAWGRFYTELKTRSGSVSGSVCLLFLCSVNATPI